MSGVSDQHMSIFCLNALLYHFLDEWILLFGMRKIPGHEFLFTVKENHNFASKNTVYVWGITCLRGSRLLNIEFSAVSFCSFKCMCHNRWLFFLKRGLIYPPLLIIISFLYRPMLNTSDEMWISLCR